jgi:tRNA A37 threonylcarbamoyladenosine synthetase subunit TsaC/SUA5/YrdC
VAHALAVGAQERGLGPITATRLGRAGASPAANVAEARALCATAADPWLVEPGADDAGSAAPPTVLDLSGGRPRLLRAGPVSLEALAEVLGLDVEEAGQGG